jgi:hypothetical protein
MSAVATIDPQEQQDFFEYLQAGVGAMNAAVAVGWTPRQLRRMLSDDEFSEMVDAVRERRIEGYEHALHEKAMAGNMVALQMVLYCQASDRGWRPPATRVALNRTTKVEVSLTTSVVEAARQVMATSDVAALQPGGALDDIVDAEIVD